ncbi:GSCOCG00011849001-RA-CDS [Cotesia congregata]|nr:GSCOCG00011849001-RA-CDS [Cotesia congregata]
MGENQCQLKENHIPNTNIREEATASAQVNQQPIHESDYQNNSPIVKTKRGRRSNLESLSHHRSSSTCSITDYFKRKRNLDDSLEKSFQETADKILASLKKKQFREEHLSSPSNDISSSAPVAASSPETMNDCESILKAINDLRVDLNNKMDALRISNEDKFSSLENKVSKRIEAVEVKQRTDFKNLNNKYDNLALSLQNINKRLDSGTTPNSGNDMYPAKMNKLLKIAQNMEKKDREERKDNIVIKGLNNSHNLEEATVLINDFLKSKYGLSNCYKSLKVLGKDQNIYKITLMNSELKKQIMANKKRNLADTRVFIENDLTEQQASEMYNLRLATKEHKLKGDKVKFFRNKVSINDKWMQWDEDQGGLVESRTPVRNIESKKNNNPTRTSKHNKQ